MRVKKRNGKIVKYNDNKIKNAVILASESINYDGAEKLATKVANRITRILNRSEFKTIYIEVIQDMVESSLAYYEAHDVLHEYVDYRNKSNALRKDTSKLMRDFIIDSRYSNWLEDEKRSESFEEIIDRVKNMHIEKFSPNDELKSLIDEGFKDVHDGYLLPSMRSLQFGGKPILKKNARIYNCSYSLCDRLDFFKEFTYLLLCGCGCGFSVSKTHVNKMPFFREWNGEDVEFFQIPDTIEGWSEAIDFCVRKFQQGIYPEFDYSLIRPKGAKISSNGKAPGHIPLKNAIEEIRKILLNVSNRQLKPIESYDMAMHIADCVISGGVRRCLPVDYEVRMGNGKYKKLSKIKKNDTVLVEGDIFTITNVHKNKKQQLYKIFTEDGSYHEATAYHRWWVVNVNDRNVSWKMVKEIQEDPTAYAFINDDDEEYPITKVIKTDIKETIDIEVDIAHSFVARNPKTKLESISHNSATICLFDEDDDEMANAKTGKWFELHPHRARSNNSARLIRKDVQYDEFSRLFDIQKEWGEPGFYFADHVDHGANPCLAGDTLVLTEHGDMRIDELVETIKTEDVDVLTFNIDKNEYEWEKVIDGDLTRENAEIIELDFDEITSLRLTPDHKVFTVNRGWVEAKDVELGDVFLEVDSYIKNNDDKTWKVTKKKAENEDVYDITTEFNHNFFANGILVHNCVEIGMNPVLDDGRSGWQFCNLVEINGMLMDNEETFYRICRSASIVATLQAGYTDLGNISEATVELAKRDALIGVSITGIMDSPDVLLNPEVLKKGAKIVGDTNSEVAKLIGINPSKRTNCVKPAGTTSLVFGSASGIHPRHSEKYFRRVQISKTSDSLKAMREANPHMIEGSVWSTSGADDVVTFCVTSPKGAIVRDDLTALKHLEIVKLVQENWVLAGDKDNSPHHNVSCTISVSEDEWEDVKKYIWDNRDYFTGISMLPKSGDKDYPQAPHEGVYTDADKEKWKILVENSQEVDYQKIRRDDDNTNLSAELACAGGHCEL